MELFFRSKAESNDAQEKEFLALSPSERVYRFFELMMQSKKYPSKNNPKKDNFVIEIITQKD